ncbi:hypothetical protein KJ855_04590 [Patescibacteria group bacterium]|nr:hypothetical protein [Patescibacteria group bacterium]
MKNAWTIGGIVLFVYVVSMGIVSWYYSVPSDMERKAQQVIAKPINAMPVSDELAADLQGREQYGEWPIDIVENRVGKSNPFRL